MMRIALGIEYDGAKFYGWQRQKDVISVQQVLEESLAKVANEPIRVHCAGRTDCGVHGTGQVVHFDTTAVRNKTAWIQGVNAKLPGSVAVRWAHDVSDDFHARFSATARRYRYILCNSTSRPAILAKGLSFYYQPLDADVMQQAANLLVGEHDFTSYRAKHCQAHSPVRTIHHLNVTRRGDFIIIDAKANGFLHHMVRNIVGSLIEVGMGKQPVEFMTEVLNKQDRTYAPATAKPGGLYLVEVDYPPEFGLPKPATGPLFL